MAKVEIDKGRDEPAQALAGRIVTGQETELAEMAQLLRPIASVASIARWILIFSPTRRCRCRA